MFLRTPVLLYLFSFCFVFPALGDLLAHDLPQPWERLKIKRINKQPMVQTSHLLAVDTGARTTIGVVPVLLMLLHKMAKR